MNILIAQSASSFLIFINSQNLCYYVLSFLSDLFLTLVKIIVYQLILLKTTLMYQVLNFSTGRIINKTVFDSEVTSMDHDHTGQLIFCGDAQVCNYIQAPTYPDH